MTVLSLENEDKQTKMNGNVIYLFIYIFLFLQ